MSSSPEVYSCVFCPHSGPVFLRVVFSSILLLVLVSANSSLATAQSPTATLTGTVMDENHAVIPGVNIAVINIAQGFQRSAVTDGNGAFVVPLLSPGNYTVKAEREGFTPER
jgi:hypothetical protein